MVETLLKERIRRAASDGKAIETAQVKLFGLADVRAAAGASWPRLRDYVHDRSIKLMRAYLGPDDAIIACEDGFLIVFAQPDPQRAELACADVRDALIKHYLGEDTLNAIRVRLERESYSLESFARAMSTWRAPASAPERGLVWPVYSFQKQSNVACLFAPQAAQDSQPPRIGYSPRFVERATHEGGGLVEIDLMLLEQARAAAREHAGVFGVTVHSTTLRDPRTRVRYLQAAARVPARRRMFVSIAEIQPGVTLLALTEWCFALKLHFDWIALDLHHSDRVLAGIGATGAWAAGFQLPPRAFSNRKRVAASLRELEIRCGILRRQKLQPFVTGFPDEASLDFAHVCNVAFAAGQESRQSIADAVSPPSLRCAAVESEGPASAWMG